ncbi:hypothetical protein ACFW04_014347 [Cataglyphis niger]
MAMVGFTQNNLHHSKGPNPRAAIAIKGLEAELMSEFCSKNVAAITRKIVVSSAYFPHEKGGSLPPKSRMGKLVEYCQAKELPLIYPIWGSININDRGRRLLEYLNVRRHEVLDLTLCSKNLISKIVGWQVSSEPSLSDYGQIVFRRNPRRTVWNSFREDLSNGLCGFPKRHLVLMGSFENCAARAVYFNKRIS